MRCKDCKFCYKGWFPSRPNAYVCIGVMEPFVINDINQECTEYSKEQWKEWGKKPKTIKTNADHIRSMNNEELAKFFMFEVIYRNERYKVYSIRDDKVSNIPDFLIYINYHWTWVSCIYCTPVI